MSRIPGIITAITLTTGSLATGVPVASAYTHQSTPIEDEEDASYTEVLSILGPTEVSADRMWAFVAAINPNFSPEIARAYYEVGRRYGIRGDVALCQAVIETGWFKFTGGTAVTPDQHNYCGLGVTIKGVKGHAFHTVEDGVTAQIQHLYAYATRQPIPLGETLIDPRFSLVNRGVAANWTDLNHRWAANDHYGQSILALFGRMLNDDPPATGWLVGGEVEVPVLELGIPDEYFE